MTRRRKTRNVRDRQARRYVRRLKPNRDVRCCNQAFPLWGTRTLDRVFAADERRAQRRAARIIERVLDRTAG